MAQKRAADLVNITPASSWNPRVGNLPSFPSSLVTSPPLSLEEAVRKSKKPRLDPSLAEGSTEILLIRERFTKIKKTQAVLDFFASQDRYGLGDFLAHLFDPKTLPQLSERSAKSVEGWLQGSTRKNTRPAEIFDAIQRHPSCIRRDDTNVRHSNFFDLGPPPNPPSFVNSHPQKTSLLPPLAELMPEDVNSREGLEELMVRGALLQVEREAHTLADLETGLGRGAGMTWELLSDLSNYDQREKMQTTAPVIWAVFATIALARNTSAPTQKESGRKNTKSRDPTLVSANYLVFNACLTIVL